jgi:PAS domain S-box-containing protein
MEHVGLKKNDPYKRLAEINRAITTSLNFAKVLDLIVENASSLVRARVTALILVDKDGLLRIKAARGIDTSLLNSFARPMKEEVIRELHRSFVISEKETLFTVPVIAGNALNGMLLIAREEKLNEDEEWQLSALADQAAIALRNARLFEMELAEASRERDETKQALRVSKQKINAILGSTTDLFFALDREWRFRDLNRNTEILFQRKPEDLLGEVIWDVFPQALQSPLYESFHRAIREMSPVHFETASTISESIWFEAHAYPSEEGLSVYLRDITERRTAEIARHRLASIVESSGDAIISKDLRGIINSWNQAAERIFGYTAEEAIGQSITLIVPTDRLDEERQILNRIRQGQHVRHYETVRRTKSGSAVDISLTISPIKDASGTIIGASKIARDISERIRREAEIRFQIHLLSAVEQAVIATDLTGKILYWNSFAEALYGWKQEEAVGSTIREVTPLNDVNGQLDEILAQIRKGESWVGEFQAKRKDGSVFPAMSTNSPIYDNQGTVMGIVGVSFDISARKHAEEERAMLLERERRARTEAETANRLKDEFLATLSHELRNPLNVILGYSEVLLRSEEAQASPFLKRTAETLRRNALAQSRLVRDLLDLSRLHMGKLSLNRESVSLSLTIMNAVETVRAEAAAKNVDLRIASGDESLFVDADSLRLEQVIWNLLNNAVKFTPSGGKVTIGFRRQEGEAVVNVRDTGQGIDPAFLPHIWEMFRQADASSSRRHGGMGIGLALVSQLVELHGGSVAVSSEGLGKGSEFTIRIPLADVGVETQGPNIDFKPGLLSKFRILVVDDSEDTIEMLRRLFEMDGAAVSTARSGQTALTIARENEFDVVLSDISMPEMDGFEFLKRLRAISGYAEVPVLALTGFGRAEDVQRAQSEGFFAHVTKPIDLDILIKILQDIPLRAGAIR